MDYLQMWVQDKAAIIATMAQNMEADLAAGWNPMGINIRNQLDDIMFYTMDVNKTLREVQQKDPAERQRWARNDLKKRGVIE